MQKIAEYNLTSLLGKLYHLFCQMPPVSFDELFGSQQAQPQVLQKDTNIASFVGYQNDEWEDISKCLSEYEPSVQLKKVASGKEDGGMSHLQRKTVWKMNTQMKKEMDTRIAKEKIIKNELHPQIKELAITNVADLKSKQITDLAKEMDVFEDNSQLLAKKLTRI